MGRSAPARSTRPGSASSAKRYTRQATTTRDDLERLLALTRELGLHKHDITDALGRIRLSLDALAIRDALQAGTRLKFRGRST